MSHDYTVRLEQLFQGPMDLLLHLVREQEVEIHEIEINRVIDGYLAWLKNLEQFDIELAADFVLMAATLMSIKSRSLLPSEEVDLEKELDPRDELIQRLIEYRSFKEASRELSERFDERGRLFSHGAHTASAEEPTIDLSEVSRWDLLSAFSRLMRETLANRALRIATDERPLRYWVERLVGWVRAEERVSLRALVESAAAQEGASRQVLIGTFCALLELMKLGVVRAWQEDPRSDIVIALRDDLGLDVEEIVRLSGFDDEGQEEGEPSRTSPEVAGEPDPGEPPSEPTPGEG
ncbi:MAG TPA: segregation/condensation protein A [Planctomycetota bacterium]|nr:segregation/condensation protein A [Planctomycetota bacterium]